MDILRIFVLLFPGISCATVTVVSGVFQVSDVNVSYSRAEETCYWYNASLATSDQLETALAKEFQTCKWGWVKEKQLVMVRAFGEEACAQNATGVLKKYTEAESAFCYKHSVVKGVFQVSIAQKYNLTWEDGNKACQTLNATFATEAQLITAYNVDYETCRTGWVKEGKNLLPRHTSDPKCGNGSIGLLSLKASDGLSDVFCFRDDLIDSNMYLAFPVFNTKINYTEALKLCSSFGDLLASKKEAQAANVSNLVQTGVTTIWFQDGIAVVTNQTLYLQPCMNDTNITAPVYCYNPLVTNQTRPVYKTDEMWRKITIGCILATIFIILLCAALFMKGNQFICCLEKKHSTYNEMVESNQIVHPAQTWNTTGFYQPMQDVIDPKYQNPYQISIENRSPAVRPEMIKYRTHFYDNLSYIKTENE